MKPRHFGVYSCGICSTMAFMNAVIAATEDFPNGLSELDS